MSEEKKTPKEEARLVVIGAKQTWELHPPEGGRPVLGVEVEPSRSRPDEKQAKLQLRFSDPNFVILTAEQFKSLGEFLTGIDSAFAVKDVADNITFEAAVEDRDKVHGPIRVIDAPDDPEKAKAGDLDVGDYVRFNHANGSTGKIVARGLRFDRYPAFYVEWVYGRDNQGEVMKATSQLIKPHQLVRITQEEYEAMRDRAGCGDGREKKEAPDLPRTMAHHAHTDDLAVDRFAEKMKAKLAKARVAGKRGWDDPSTDPEDLAMLFFKSAIKGDSVSAANYAMFLEERQDERSKNALKNVAWLLRLQQLVSGPTRPCDECKGVGFVKSWPHDNLYAPCKCNQGDSK